MKLLYGWNEDGKFVLLVVSDESHAPIIERISLTRAEVNKITAHMRFGRKGDTRELVDHKQLTLAGSATRWPTPERSPNGDPDTIVPAPAPHKRRPV